MYYHVIVPVPLDKSLTYAVLEPVKKGQIVEVPWRNKRVFGLVVECDAVPPEGVTLKEATPLPLVLSERTVSFIQGVAHYTLTSLGWVWRMVLGGVDLHKVITQKTQENIKPTHEPILKSLSVDQEEAVTTIGKSLLGGAYHSFLLDGVTGSGKTEVYFHSIADVLKQRKQALVLFPEIGLSHQWLNRFEEQFGFKPHVWHSHTSSKKRLEAWKAAANGTLHVFIGARSALFLPYQNLGLIIVDEEHDGSYKQEEQGHYHARDMAILRAYHEKVPIVLASATPSLESIVNAEQGKSAHLLLLSRFGGAQLPKVRLVDRRNKTRDWLSDELKIALHKRLSQGEQSLLFLNRRGYAPMTLCVSCGHHFECPGCSASLVQHRFKSSIKLQCHHCGFSKPLDPTCPQCLTTDSLIPCGPGIDRVIEEVAKIFPTARIACLTSDMPPKQQRAIWEIIHKGGVDMIIGTQLIAKGHHMPNLTLVGMIDADMGLHGSDLRGTEKAFQLLQQVGGRAGRDVKPGEVLIQTYQPDNPLFKAIQNHDRNGFIRYEMALRREMSLPPYARLVSLILSGLEENTVRQSAKILAAHLNDSALVQVLGPAPALMLRIKSRYRYRILLKANKRLNISDWLKQKIISIKIPSSIRLDIDIDPINFI